jgi:hypothetical protein
VFRVIDDTRDRAIFRLAYYCHGLRPSEIGMIQVKESTPRQNANACARDIVAIRPSEL